MSTKLISWSEEDLRTKVISQWLVGHGFNWNDLFFEFSFTIQLGRSHFGVCDGHFEKVRPSEQSLHPRASIYRPRADVLVRDGEGRNLLIVEAKAPDEALDDEARDQGISYARLLVCGNIAPFVVLTNGRETRIYDSLTKERLDGTVIPSNHPHVRAGFRISGDDIALRAEALTALISLSPDNLNSFCQAQVERRMSLLRSADLHSGKKYIPSLYVERNPAKLKLNDLLDVKRRSVVVLIGPPQVGKTNFICHEVEGRLAKGEACLFYPAVGMREGLLAEIADDFEWVLGEHQSSHRQIITKLRSVLRRTGQKLVVFIDGWNEASVSLAQTIDQDSELICQGEIQIVISVTSTSLRRLLIGEAGNPSFIAQAADLDLGAIQLLGISPDAGQRDRRRSMTEWIEGCSDINSSDLQWSVVSLPRYSEDEMQAAYRVYADAFNASISQSHKRKYEPYTLGIAMKLFQNGVLPDRLDEPALMEAHITDKLNRVVGVQQYDARMFLLELAAEMCNTGAPVTNKRALERWGLPVVARIPSGLYEAALFAEASICPGEPAVDFYYGRERDYIIAYWVNDWLTRLKCGADLSAKFSLSTQSNAGLDSLRWFLQQPLHIQLLESNHGGLRDSVGSCGN